MLQRTAALDEMGSGIFYIIVCYCAVKRLLRAKKQGRSRHEPEKIYFQAVL